MFGHFDMIIKYDNIKHLIEVKNMLKYNKLLILISLFDFNIKF